MELQCRERVDLLQALQESRKAAQKDAEGNGNGSGRGSSGKDSSFLKGKFNSKSSSSVATSSTAGAGAGTPHAPGWIGDGTIPAVGYTDLSKPAPGLPPPQPTIMNSASLLNDDVTGQSSPKTKSRGSSPDRRKPMLSTLRSTDSVQSSKKKPSQKKSSPRRKQMRPAASQAAGLAWESIARSPSSEKRLSNPGDELARRADRVNDSNDYIPDLYWREARTSTPARSPGTRPSPAEPRQSLDARQRPSSNPVPGKDAGQSSSPPKPAINPKPAALRASQQATAKSSRRVESDSPLSYTPRRRSRPANTSSKPQAASTPRTKIEPVCAREPYSPARDDERLTRATDRTYVSAGAARRKSQPKRSITPPSSDQESSGNKSTDEEEGEGVVIEDVMNRLPKGVDADIARQILNEIVVRGDEVHWDDIAGLEGAKKALKEAVVYPFLRPDLFSGLREPTRGMLLFGPPGTGKTMLARAVATESKSTFFSVSASTLTSKWHGESEKLVRSLFALAKALAPSIIFVDEIDSLLSTRSSGTEHEASRRSKTEFLIQWSDLQSAAAGRDQSGKDKKEGDASRVLVLAATNRPWDIDEAARRRFVRRQYIPLPEHHVRSLQIQTLLSHQVHDLNDEDIEVLVRVTEGTSPSVIPVHICTLANMDRLLRLRHHCAGQRRGYGPATQPGRGAVAHTHGADPAYTVRRLRG